jgi:hypothetical protein
MKSLQLHMDKEELNEIEMIGYTTVSFMDGEGSPNL